MLRIKFDQNVAPEPYRPAILDLSSFPNLNFDQWGMLVQEFAGDADAKMEEIFTCFLRHPDIDRLTRRQAVREGYSIAEHTLMVLNQFDKYFCASDLPNGVSRAMFIKLLLIHDLGKGISNHNMHQLENNLTLLELLAPKLGFTASELVVARSVIGADVIGRFFVGIAGNERSGHQPSVSSKLEYAHLHFSDNLTEEALRKFTEQVTLAGMEQIEKVMAESLSAISAKSEEAGLSAQDWLQLGTILFQCDASAYTIDAERRLFFFPDLAPHLDRRLIFSGDQLRPYQELASERMHIACFYAYLEDAARANAILPNAKFAYPSLDFLFHGVGMASQCNRYQRSESASRLKFASQFENWYLELARSV